MANSIAIIIWKDLQTDIYCSVYNVNNLDDKDNDKDFDDIINFNN